MRRVHASSSGLQFGALRLRRWLAFAAAGFAFLFASTHHDALASCGDYVIVGGAHGVMVGGAHGHDMSHASQSSPGDSRGVPTCSGPHCQRQAPPPAPRHVVVSGPHELACWLLAGDSQADAPSKRVNEPSLLTSQATTRPLDRPPRVSR